MSLNRRGFIKTTSLASATFILADAMGMLPEKLELPLDHDFNADFEFHLVDNNLINLHFYFINAVKRNNNTIEPRDYAKRSYMIVRLPQQHVSEKAFWATDWGQGENDKIYPAAKLSGYSYLAFELFPDILGKDNTPLHRSKSFEFSIANLLNWNDDFNFSLITLVEWFNLKNKRRSQNAKKYELDFRRYEKDSCNDFIANKIWNKKPEEIKAEFDSDYYRRYDYEPEKSVIYQRYKSIVRNLLDHNFEELKTDNDFVPITFFEMPQALVLVPIIRNKDGKLSKTTDRVKRKFWTNKIINKERTIGNTKIIRKYEVWNNTLFYQREPQFEQKDHTFKIELPSFRAIGLLTDEVIPCPDTSDCSADNQKNILPSILDKVELAFLTQYANDHKDLNPTYRKEFADQAFDIKEVNGLFFTGLGVITHLKYYNIEKRPPKIDLIEFEQIIEQGRDVFVKVARLGYNTKTGQKYKHVIEAKRRIGHHEDDLTDPTGTIKYPLDPTSFMELRQYCECIDKEISYIELLDEPKPNEDFEKTPWKKELQNGKFLSIPESGTINAIIAPAFYDEQEVHYRRLPYKSLTVNEAKRIPIKCLTDKVVVNDICELQNTFWFWPVLDLLSIKENDADSTISLKNYLHCEYEARDWEDQIIKGSTPFMFVRATLLDECASTISPKLTAAYANYFKGSFNAANEIQEPVFFERRKTYLQNQYVAFSPSLKAENAKETAPSRSKVNIVETDFIETYFNVRQVGSTPSQLVKYVMMPQLLRFKGFSDHIKELTDKKIPQVLEYHDNYIKYKYRADFTDVMLGNHGTMILGNTEAFMEKPITRSINKVNKTIVGIEEPINRQYGVIKKSIQESKNKLGNLVIPDIHIDTFSLEKFGVTVPKDIASSIKAGKTVIANAQDTLNKISHFNPRELLRGKMSDVCGLDLTVILDELLPVGDENMPNQTPLFEINKAIDKLKGDVLNSEVYKKITAFTLEDPLDGNKRKPPLEIIASYEAKIKQFTAQVNAKREEINRAIRTVADLIPNTAQLDNLVKTYIDKYKVDALTFLTEMQAFEDISTYLTEAKITEINNFINDEVTVQKEEFLSKVEELKLMGTTVINYLADAELIKELQKYPELRDKINAFKDNTLQQCIVFLTQKYTDLIDPGKLETKLKASFENLTQLSLETTIKYRYNNQDFTVKFDPDTLELGLNAGKELKTLGTVANAGLIQMQQKIDDLQALMAGTKPEKLLQTELIRVVKTYNDTYLVELGKRRAKLEEFQGDLTKFYTELNKWTVEFQQAFGKAVESGLNSKAQETILKINAIANRINPYIDVIRKFDPYFYYTEAIRIKKEIDDIRRRFKPEFIEQLSDCEEKIKNQLAGYKKLVTNYVAEIRKTPITLESLNKTRNLYLNGRKNLETVFANYPKEILSNLTKDPKYKNALAIYNSIDKLGKDIIDIEADLKNYLGNYKKILQQQGSALTQELDKRVKDFIKEREMELTASGVDIPAIQREIVEAKHIYKLLTSIKQQELSYKWKTDRFKDINLGMVSFKKFTNPTTTLSVDVKAITHFSLSQFPPTIERVETYSYNKFSNFAIGFFSCITIGFSEVTFEAGSATGTHFDVKIKSVQFDGALSFVQAFQSYLKTIGKGLILELRPDHVGLGYSLPIPAIQTPAFSFFNLSLNLDLRVYFDSRPLRFGFSLATAESKFGITAGIYAGFGFFSIVADPKKGVVEIDCALEAGAWSGLRMGPFSGEVKLAFGFRYTKNEKGVRLEGYIVAEGRLSVWIFEVSARIYLGVISQNSYVYGLCTVTYSFKVGITSKSFSGTFVKHIAGAAKENNEEDTTKILKFIASIDPKLNRIENNAPIRKQLLLELDKMDQEPEELELLPVNSERWREFITIF